MKSIKIIQNISIACALLLVMPCFRAYAFFPPDATVEEALRNGDIAFIGRITRIEEIENKEFWSKAIADVDLIQVFYGLESNTAKTVRIQFYSRLFSGHPYPGFDLRLSVSDVVLFVLNSPRTSEESVLYFNSYWQNPKYPGRKIDLAYQAGNSPNDRFSPEKEDHLFVSAYPLGEPERVAVKDLFKWASEGPLEAEEKEGGAESHSQ